MRIPTEHEFSSIAQPDAPPSNEPSSTAHKSEELRAPDAGAEAQTHTNH